MTFDKKFMVKKKQDGFDFSITVTDETLIISKCLKKDLEQLKFDIEQILN